jgi:hypothetical protein
LIQGRKGIDDLFLHLFSHAQAVEPSVAHLSWIQTDDIAIHLVEKTIQRVPPGTPPPPPSYAPKIYRKDNHGWRLTLHQNAPTPQHPPPGPKMPE